MSNEQQPCRDPFYDLVPERMWLKVTNIGVRAPGMIRVILEVNGQDKELYHSYVAGGIISQSDNLYPWVIRGTHKEENDTLRSQLAIATDALVFISWPGVDRDHWDRVDAARVALAKIQEMGKSSQSDLSKKDSCI